jgi:hypothetical protein
MSRPVTIAREGFLDAILLARMLRENGLDVGPMHGGRGKGRLDERLPGYVRAAIYGPWIVLRDLDRDADCAPDLVRRLVAPLARGGIAAMPTGLCLIVAVHQMEAWLLADRQGIAEFLHVTPSVVPVAPETLPDAKQALVGLARRSRSRTIREGMAPTSQSGRKVGTRYTEMMQRFIEEEWDPARAIAGGAGSLAKLAERIDRFRATDAWTTTDFGR